MVAPARAAAAPHPYTGGLAPLCADAKAKCQVAFSVARNKKGKQLVNHGLSSTPIALLLASVLERRLSV